MKTLKYFFLALTVILISVATSSCSKDDEPSVPTTGNIVGTWQADEVQNVGQQNQYTLSIIFTFNANGTGSIRELIKYVTGAESSSLNTFRYTVATATDGTMTITRIDDEDNYKVIYKATQTGNTILIDGLVFKRV